MEATSPTDRIEQLLNKYKARYNLSSAATDSSNSSTPVTVSPSKSDPFTWQDINAQLKCRGFPELAIRNTASDETGAVVTKAATSQSVVTAITAVLEDFDHKQRLLRQLLNDSSKENEQLTLMKEETDQTRNQLNDLQKQLGTQLAKYKELEEVHFLSLKDHAQQMDGINKDHNRAVRNCQELQTKCVNLEAETNHLKNQLATLRLHMDVQMSDTESSQRSSPVKKTVLIPPPYPDQQLENEFQVLQTQLNNLKYKNTKLQLDLQNRPERQELRLTQKRVRQLEQELNQCKTLLSSEQREMHQAQKHLESICTILDVQDMDHMIPCLQQYQVMLKAMKDMEKCLVAVVDVMAHPSSPSVQYSPAPRHGHMSWCHYSWDHVIPTLKQWLKELSGLRDLYAVFAEVCNSLKLQGTRHTNDDMFEHSSISCKQMSALLRRWLLKDHNRKVAQQQALVTMVTHYQQMFGIKWVGGVYASMSRVAMTLEETQNILKTIKEILHLDHSASGRQLVAMVEHLASNQDNTSLMAQIVEQVGLTSPTEVVERLKLCQRFFPAFQQVINEVQEFLGVHSLGAISPALHELHRKAMK